MTATCFFVNSKGERLPPQENKMPKSGSEKRKRAALLCVRVDAAEKAKIKRLADATGRPVSQYLRDLGLGYKIKSSLTQEMVITVQQHRIEVGRLGGLFRSYLSEGHPSRIEGMSIKDLLKAIESQIKLSGEYVEGLAQVQKKK